MFRIDKSSVDYSNFDKSFVVIKENPQQDAGEKKKKQPERDYDFDQYVHEEQEPAPQKADLNHLNIEERAAQILRNAEARASQILEQAIKNASEVKKAAWDEGYREGRQEGMASAIKEGKEQAVKVQGVLNELEAFKAELYGDIEKDVLSLSLDIAEKIVNQELDRSDSIYISMVKKAISRLNIEGRFVLRVNPREYKRFFKEGAEWLQDELQCAPITITEDATLEENGCVLESDDGMVNAGAQTQLKMLSLSFNMDTTQKP